MAREIFKNLPDTSTPINATKLNGIFNGEESMGSIVVEDITCKNLFDKDNIFTNRALNDGDGTVFEATNRNTTDFINVKPNSDYIFSNISRTAVCLYDNNKTFIKTLTTDLVTTTSDTYYLRFTYKTDENYSKGQLEIGSVATEYTPYKKYGYNSQESMGEIVVDDITCKNLANIEDVKVNGSEEFSKTIYDIKPNKEYTISCIKSRISGVAITQQTIWGIRKITFYDKNGTNLSAISGTTILLATNSSKKCSLTFTTPSNTSYIECRFDNNNGDANLNTLVSKVQLEPGSIATDYVEHKEYENKVLYSTNEQVIGTWTDGKPLYRKTISINTPLTTSNTEVYNFDTNFIIKNYYGFVTISASSQLIPINFYFTNEYNVATYITKNTGKINMKVGSEAYINQQATISLEYTKKTD